MKKKTTMLGYVTQGEELLISPENNTRASGRMEIKAESGLLVKSVRKQICREF